MTSAPTRQPTLEYLDPHNLTLEDNSREIGDIRQKNPDLVDSIAQHGVLQPVTANPTPDGGRHVRFGFSRTMAAIAAGLRTIPVFVVDDDSDESARLIDQMVENNIRAGYTTAEQAENVERLSLFGLTAEQIATQTSASSHSVEAALRVRRNTTAKQVLENNPQLDLLHAAAFEEFADWDEAITELAETLEEEPDQLDHAIARWRDERAVRHAFDELAEQHRTAGTTVLIDRMLPQDTMPLGRLQRSRNDPTRLDEDPATHADCPGHAVQIRRDFRSEVRTIYVCQQWREHGHAERMVAMPGGSTGVSSGPKSEHEKAEMRRVRANNKAWRAAEQVRRDWLGKLLRRKTPPKQAQQFLAATAVAGEHEQRKAMENRHSRACVLLGYGEPTWGKPHPLDSKASKANANQAIMLQLAIALGAIEDSTNVDTWRRPTSAHKRYFAALRDWGYTLSPVEKLVLDPTADADQWPHLNDTTHPDQDQDDLAADTEFDDLDEHELDDAETTEPGEEVDEPTD